MTFILSALCFRIFSQGISLVRLRRKQGVKFFLAALLIALPISILRSDMKAKLSLKNLCVFAILAVWTLDIQPRPAVSRQAARHPALDHWQTLNPDLSAGDRWSPKVRNPTFSPLSVLALPLFSSDIILFIDLRFNTSKNRKLFALHQSPRKLPW